MKKRFPAAILAGLMLTAALGWMVYAGVIRFNHPSETQYPVRGVDVSHYQGEIDFDALADQGMRFAFIKATEGSAHVDPMLEKNREGVLNSSMRSGFYHFFSFDSPGKTQAENFIDHVPALEGMLPPVIDVEYYGNYFRNPPDAERVEPELRAMVEALEEAYGVKPVIYCTMSAYRRYIKEGFPDCDLWIRNVYWTPRVDREWTFWQYTDKAKLSGYDGDEPCIDVNVFCGSEEQFEQYGR